MDLHDDRKAVVSFKINLGIEYAVLVGIQIRGLIWRIWRDFIIPNFKFKSMRAVCEFTGGHFAFPSYSGCAGKNCFIRKFRILRARKIYNFFIPIISGSVFYGNPVNEKTDFDFVGPVFNEDKEFICHGFNVDCGSDWFLCGACA